MSTRGRGAASLAFAAAVAAASAAHASPPGSILDAPAGPAVETSPGIALRPDPAQDEAIERRLEAIYAELPTLDEVEVEVAAGVVHLGGQVFELSAGVEAEAIARRVEGVVTVDNRVEQSREVGERVWPLLDRLRARGRELALFSPLLLVGALIVAAFWVLARLLARVAQRRQGARTNLFVRDMINQIVRTGLVVLGIVLALELMGATTLLAAVLGAAGVAGLALGFAFKDTAENYIASLMLSVRQPFEPNDLVEVEGHVGRVVRLTSRATILLTLDGNHVRIPNATVFKGTIINYTRNPERRFSFELGVAVEADLARVQEMAIKVLIATPGVLSEPPPTCLVDRFGDSAVILWVAAWVDQREADWFKVGSEARRRIKVAFERAGVEMPEPIFQIRTRAMEYEPQVQSLGDPHIEELEAADVRPDLYVLEQVTQERRGAGEDDLLRKDAPIE